MAPLPPRAQPTIAAIDAWYEAHQDDGWREHLGASLIGHECSRAIWYSWRWATRAHHTGRLLRLFERGQLEEARFIKALRAIGVTVLDLNPDTGRQWTVRDESGHFGGSKDAVALGVPEAPKTRHLVEFKTFNAKTFAALVREGVAKAKPQHAAQMQTYMHLAGLTRAIYLAVCKDDDQLYTERLEYDAEAALRLLAKAQRIIASPEPPERIATSPTFHVCRFCDHAPVCWEGAFPERHCRSCLSSTPAAEGKWQCEKHGHELDLRDQKAGCEDHRYIPALVAGEQIDVVGDCVVYRMRDGSEWIDGEPGC